MLTLRVLSQTLTLTEAVREHGVVHRTDSEFTVVLQLRRHAVVE